MKRSNTNLGLGSLLFLFGFCQALIRTAKSIDRKSACVLSARSFFRGRSVPYAETLAEQRSREMWEHEPFHHANEIINGFLSSDFPSKSPVLQKLEKPAGTTNSAYEDLFRPLYESKGDDVDVWNTPEIELPARKEKIRHFLIRVAYKGSDFCGWQIQPANDRHPSVQGVLEDWMEPLAERKQCIRVCGRTDAGVSAVGQVCRFRTAFDLEAKDVYNHLQNIPSKNVNVQQVIQVTRAFHPKFAATCRAYVYLIDCAAWEGFGSEKLNLLNRILQALEGKELDFFGMSYGRLKTQTSMCTLHHARACLVSIDQENTAICIELVGNRFLRRMVRFLVEAAIRIALTESSSSSEDALLKQIEQKDRRLVGSAAPPDGLFFVGARFNVM
jgi:tRNA pseudouridine38-40 synthase